MHIFQIDCNQQQHKVNFEYTEISLYKFIGIVLKKR